MSNFDEIVALEKNGKVLVGIDRAFARKFYTDLPIAAIREKTGEAPYLEKTLVLVAFVGEYLAVFASVIASVFILGWWSAILIPLGIVLWFWYSSTSSIGGGRMNLITLALLFAIAGCAVSGSIQRSYWVLALIYIFSLWLGRFVYSGSTVFLRLLVLRNRKAFEWLRGNLTIREIE